MQTIDEPDVITLHADDGRVIIGWMGQQLDLSDLAAARDSLATQPRAFAGELLTRPPPWSDGTISMLQQQVGRLAVKPPYREHPLRCPLQ